MSITGTTSVIEGTTALVKCTGTGGTAPYTFLYDINGGSALEATTGLGFYSDTETQALQGSFDRGYTYAFEQIATGVKITFNLLDNWTGVVAFLWTQSPFVEQVMTGIGNTFTISLNKQIGSTVRIAVKFQYVGGHSCTTYKDYVVGSAAVTVNAITSTAGVFVYRLLQVTDKSGAIQSGSAIQQNEAIVTVIGNNTVSAPSSVPSVLFAGSHFKITHLTTGAIGIASTTFPNGVTAEWFNNTITISGACTIPGTFSYSIPLTGGVGSITADGTVTIHPMPVADAGEQLTVTRSSSVTTTGVIAKYGVAQWSHDGNGSFSVDNNSANITYSPVDDDVGKIITLTMTVRSDYDASVTVNSTCRISVTKEPSVITFSGSTTLAYTGRILTPVAVVKGSTVMTYSYNLLDGPISEPVNPGRYRVTVTVPESTYYQAASAAQEFTIYLAAPVFTTKQTIFVFGSRPARPSVAVIGRSSVVYNYKNQAGVTVPSYCALNPGTYSIRAAYLLLNGMSAFSDDFTYTIKKHRGKRSRFNNDYFLRFGVPYAEACT